MPARSFGRRSDAPDRTAFTLVELLVVLAIIGVLMGLLIPAVQAVRESARRTSCKSNLKQIGLALSQYTETMGRLPPSRPADGFLTWCVFIMPYQEQAALYERFDLQAPYADQDPATVLSESPLYYCPTRRTQGASRFESKGEPRGAVGDYAGNAGSSQYFLGDAWALFDTEVDGVLNSGLADQNPIVAGRLTGAARGRYRLADIRDGLSTTVLVGEKAVSWDHQREPGGWGDGSIYNGSEPGTAMRLGGYGMRLATHRAIPAPGPGTIPVFGSAHGSLCHFLFVDGHVSAVSTTTDEETLRRLCSRRDGETVESF